ncbi:hypothetical protein ACWDUH_00095 [Micromonospora wenchangensis]
MIDVDVEHGDAALHQLHAPVGSWLSRLELGQRQNRSGLVGDLSRNNGWPAVAARLVDGRHIEREMDDGEALAADDEGLRRAAGPSLIRRGHIPRFIRKSSSVNGMVLDERVPTLEDPP